MSPLALLHTLHAHPSLTFHRVGEGVKVLPRTPEKARPALVHFKPAILRALEEGERLEASTLLRDPHRLAALLAHALGGEAPVVLTGYYEGPPTRYLVAVDRLTPYLAWAALPLPRRLHLAALDGRWAVDVVGGWEVGLEAVAAGTRYVLLYPEHGARGWLEAARAGLALHGVSVWRPGAAPRPLLLTAA
ncbi:hypothetical protein TthHC11_09200 [Thermus thermophilus]|uniref:hypothetical protein n=1 Tax=Thermus thermophilus TaxID=274 RepID=UPI0011641AD0|nr:hypothetical protein [Thermus thermophilus]BBL93386.1 hypothetical protein TthHC11_09200 [Thermus thermophilus]